MMGHSFASSGLFHHWSPIAQYSSERRRIISDQLPVPNGITITLTQDEEMEDTGDQKPAEFVTEPTKMGQIVERFINSQNGDDAFEAIKDALVEFNKTKQFKIPAALQNEPKLGRLVYVMNKHNIHKVTEEEAKNVAVDSIRSVCQDPRNVQSAHSPIDAATSRLKRLLKDISAGTIGDENDLISIFQLQEDNQTGKKVVGVMANALKAFLTLTQYYNNYYHNSQNVLEDDKKYFLNSIVINGRRYYMSSIANTNLEQEQIKALKDSLLKYAKVPDEILQTKDDVSIILSAMVTLATDNAKELALAKLRASLNLASMHTYLLTMGVPPEEVVKYTAKSKLFEDLYDLTKANAWEKQTGKLNDAVFNTLAKRSKEFTLEQIRNGNGYTQDDVKQLKNLYHWAQEFRTLTSLLSINQGMDNGIAKVISFKLQFEDIIKNRLKQINIQTPTMVQLLQQIVPVNQKLAPYYGVLDNIILSHGLKPNEETRAYYTEKIKRFVENYGDFRLLDSIDMNKYYTDNNYRNMVVDLYDIFKASVNVFDVVNSMPSFNEMLNSLNTIMERVAKGAKGEFLFKQLKKIYSPMVSEILPWIINDSVVKGAQSFCDDYFVCDFLINQVQKDYAFQFDVNTTGNKWTQYKVDFNSNEGLERFNTAFNIMIARLKRGKWKNDFTKSLVSYTRKDRRVLYSLNFNLDQLNKNQAGEQQLKYNQIVGGFNEVMNIPIKNIFSTYRGNEKMTVGDMFYLYNLIFNLGQRGQRSFTALLDQYITQSGENSLLLKFLNNTLAFDLKQKTIIPSSDNLNYHIAKRLTRNSNPIVIGNKQIDQKSQILTNFSTVQKKEALQNTYQRFLDALRTGKVTIEMDLNCN